ncbi:MAG: DegT/DnrJ/EryC1/StrS family aminotransferase [Bacteroidales bacterium]|nr:DegT/DnrJ/EryC1/StrS family aminotransferase [Bacteroidales bacterium]MBN2819494.1 DegT/DnrJ/EryC1/StrS family aminotransferase [Bacteroidales bacterium]
MDKLEDFCEKRKENFKPYIEIFSPFTKYLILPIATENADPAWFSFILTVKEEAPFKRDELTAFLNQNLIETRNLFAGNMVRQPGFINQPGRVADKLDVTDYIMNNTFFLGTYPGLDKSRIDYIEEKVKEFMTQY